jgi:hypothetical protein
VRIPATSVEYIHVPVTANVTLASLPVEVAVITGAANPVEDDWQTAAWDGDDAVLLVGPLVAGTSYRVWVRVTSTPEVPVT